MALTIDNSHLLSFIDRDIICEDITPEQSKCSKISKSILKIAGISISALGRIPFISVSLDLKRFGFYRYVLVTGNSLGFWILGSWSILHIIDEIFKPLTKEEKILLKNHLGVLSKTASIASAFFFSVSSKGVNAYIAYTYNNKNILMPIAVMISDTSFPFYSSLLSTQKFLEKRSFSKTEKKFNKMRYEIKKLIESNKALFIKFEKSEKIRYLEELNRVKHKNSKEERLQEYLSIILKKNEDIDQTKIEKYGKSFFVLNGAHLTLSHMAFLGILSYFGGQQLTSSYIGGAFAAALTIISNVYLEGTSLIKTSKRAFDELYHRITCSKKESLPKQLSPKLSLLLQSLGLLISVNAWGPNVEVADDYIEYQGFKMYFGIVSTLAIILLVSTAMIDLNNEVIEMKIKRGSEEEKEILLLDKKFQRLINVIEKCSFVELIKFTNAIPTETLEEIFKICKLTQDELSDYIQKYYQNLNKKELSKQEDLSPLV